MENEAMVKEIYRLFEQMAELLESTSKILAHFTVKADETVEAPKTNLSILLEAYAEYINPNFSPAVAESIMFYLNNGMSAELIKKAIYISNDNNKKSLSYIKGILDSWLQNDVKSMADFEKLKKPEKKSGQTAEDIYGTFN